MLKVLWQEKEAGRPAVPMSLLCREADTYPLAAHRILEKLADTGYCGEITNRRANADTDWTLLCNPESATLRKAVDALLVDGSVLLVKPRD